MCRNPYTAPNGHYGCGQCLPCRVNRRREWCHRLMLEQRKWSESAFITLTYRDTEVVYTDISKSEATLVPRDLQTWLKRLRKAISPARVSYYAVGEYGREGLRESIWNPHYHVIVFGLRTCEYGDSDWCKPRDCRCAPCCLLRATWGHGRVHAGTVTDRSIQYVAGYIVEKLRTEVRGDLGKRLPEFSRMSLRPCIGARSMSDVAKACVVGGVDSSGDVPAALRFGGRIVPLGRTLRKKLRKELGFDEKAPCIYDEKKALEMRFVQEHAIKAGKSIKEVLVEQHDEQVRQLKARMKIRERRKS